jgi:4-hydroxy-3-polyprenylbenzoate decarboxylase
MNTRMTVAVTGASGALYAERLLRFLLMQEYEIDLIVSDAGKITFKIERGVDLGRTGMLDYLGTAYPETREGALQVHDVSSIASPLASGSQRHLGMAVIPCSMKTLSALAHGTSTNLIERAADVTLKEGFPLVVVPRETPMNVIQIENMLTLARAGARIIPAMPAFYHQPKSIEDLADFVVGRVLYAFGIQDHRLFRPWGGTE